MDKIVDIDQVRKALSDIRLELEPLVIGPPATSIPAIRVRHLLSLLDRHLTDEGQWWPQAFARSRETATYLKLTKGRRDDV